MNQITDLKELASKTIVKAIPFGLRKTDAIGLIFTDGSYLRIGIRYGDEDDVEGIGWGMKPRYGDEEIALGLTTQAEYDRQEAESRRLLEEVCLKEERKQYDRLRAKFEGGPV